MLNRTIVQTEMSGSMRKLPNTCLLVHAEHIKRNSAVIFSLKSQKSSMSLSSFVSSSHSLSSV